MDTLKGLVQTDNLITPWLESGKNYNLSINDMGKPTVLRASRGCWLSETARHQ
jgi:hypothetical protein